MKRIFVFIILCPYIILCWYGVIGYLLRRKA